MSFHATDWDADVPNFSSIPVLSKERRKKNKGESKIKAVLNGKQKKNKTSKADFQKGKKFETKGKINNKNNDIKVKSERNTLSKPKNFKQKYPKNDNISQSGLEKSTLVNNKNKQSMKTSDKKRSKYAADNEFKNKETKSEKVSNILKIQNKKQKAQDSVLKSKDVRNKYSNQVSAKNTKFPNLFFEQLRTRQNKKNAGVKSLRERMLERLKGARFRYINEQLYLSDGKEAKTYFETDPESYDAYHEGYRQQVNKWPLNPVDVIIDNISKLPKDKVIADFGCGDAKLAKTVPHKVKSFDLVSHDSLVTECNMAHTPLLASEIDVAVYCLSLMGTNLSDYIQEANRVLKVGGVLKIAEVESRFNNIDTFITDLSKYGFKLLNKDLSSDIFYFLDFKKEREIGKKGKKNLPTIQLKACMYKKR